MARLLHKALFVLLAAAAPAAWAGESLTPADVPAAAARPEGAAPTARPAALAYVPADSDMAVLVRMDLLARSPLWKKFASPEIGLYQRETSSGLSFDPQKDAVATALAIRIRFTDDRTDGLEGAWIFESVRDIRAADLARIVVLPEAMPGVPSRVFAIGDEIVYTTPTPRILIYGTRDGLSKCLGAASAAGPAVAQPGTLPLDALEAAGEITFAARVSPALKDAVTAEYAAYQRRVLRPDMGAEQAAQFGVYYNLARLILQTETVTGSLDLSRQGDALRADIRFASPQMAPFMVAVLQAMADPLRMCLPALVGGEPLPEPPEEPFWRAAADGPVVRLVMPRVAVERQADRLLAAMSRRSAFAASAENLRRLHKAVTAFLAARGDYPQTWSAMARAGLLADPKVLENPALAEHRPGGDYDLVPLSKDAAARRPELAVLAFEACPPDARPRALNVLFADGTVQYMEYDAFERLRRQTIESAGR